MIFSEMEKVTSLCRLCGRKEENEKFHDIFESEDETDLPKKINKLLPILVIRWDPLPHGICDPCIDQLNVMERFYDNTNVVDKRLRNLLPYSPKTKLEIANPIVKIENFNRVYGNYLKTLEKLEDSVNNNKIEIVIDDPCHSQEIRLEEEEIDSELEEIISENKESITNTMDNNEQPEVIVAVKEPQEGSMSLDESPTALVDPAFTDMPSTESASVDKSPNNTLPADTPPGNKSPIPPANKSPIPPANKSPVPEVIDLVDLEEPPVTLPKKTLDCFIVQKLLDSAFYTCRQCYRTFLSSNAALSHVCEDESLLKKNPNKRTLPTLKIRVSTSSNGKHTCEFCKQSFTRKTALITHLNSLHFTGQESDFYESDFQEKHPRKKKKRVKSRDSSDSVDSFKAKKKRFVDNLEKVWEEVKPDRENLRPDDLPLPSGPLSNISVDSEKQKMPHSNEAEESCNQSDDEDNSFLICDLCDEIFLTRSNLDKHKKIHSPNAAMMPSEEEKEEQVENVESIYNLTSDEENQKGGRCLYCDKLFKNRRELNEHQKNHLYAANVLSSSDSKGIDGNDRGEDMDVYICDLCSKSFDRKSAYIAHKKIHKMDRLDDSFYEMMKHF